MQLENDTILARFVIYSDHVRKDRTPKPDLFMPDQTNTCSVFKLIGLVEDGTLRATSDAIGIGRRGKPAYGYCPITVASVLRTRASLDPNDEPKHHVNITGYAVGDPAQIKARALDLSLLARPMVDNYLQDSSKEDATGKAH